MAYRHEARGRGRLLGTPDALIAALTKHLTGNVRDFPTGDIAVEVLELED